MSDLTQMTPNLLAPRLLQFQNRYRRLCALRPQLNMARGIPAAEQVALSNAMLSLFGIFIVLVVEMAQITPPVGFNLFVLQGMTGRQIPWLGRQAPPMFL